jgi:hypothetical protein
VQKENEKPAPLWLVDLDSEGTRFRFCLDPQLGCAQRYREERNAAGQLLCRSEARDFVQSRTGLWLPRVCEVEYFSWPSIPQDVSSTAIMHKTFTVSKISHDRLPVARFVLRYSLPGTAVSDWSHPEAAKKPDKALHYRIPADIEDLDAAIRKAVDGTPYTPRLLRSSHTVRWLILIVNVVLIGLVGYWILRRKHARIS